MNPQCTRQTSTINRQQAPRIDHRLTCRPRGPDNISFHKPDFRRFRDLGLHTRIRLWTSRYCAPVRDLWPRHPLQCLQFHLSHLHHCLCARQQSQRLDRLSSPRRYRCVLSHHAWGGDDCRRDAGGEAWKGYGVLHHGTTDWADYRAFK